MWDSESAKRFGHELRALRQSRNLSQEQFAYVAGITKNQVQLLEAGRGSGAAGNDRPANPTLMTITGIASAFEMSVSEFFAAVNM